MKDRICVCCESRTSILSDLSSNSSISFNCLRIARIYFFSKSKTPKVSPTKMRAHYPLNQSNPDYAGIFGQNQKQTPHLRWTKHMAQFLKEYLQNSCNKLYINVPVLFTGTKSAKITTTS